MEVTTNNTVKEPQQVDQKQSVSGFCNYLNEVLSNLEVKPDDNDCALIAYANNQDTYFRLHGNYPDMLRTVLSMMDKDDMLAELFVEAAMIYSHRMLGKGFTGKKPDEQKSHMDKNKMTEELRVSIVKSCADAVHKVLLEAANTIIKAGGDRSELLSMFVLIGDDIIGALKAAWGCSYEEAVKRYTELLQKSNELGNNDKNIN